MSDLCTAVVAEPFDEIEEIKISSTMNEQETINVEGSHANDNQSDGGLPLSPVSDSNNIVDTEFSVGDVVDECNNLNSHVAMHSSKEKPKSTDLTVLPENCHSIAIPENPLELNGFIKTGQIFIDTAKKLKNKKILQLRNIKLYITKLRNMVLLFWTQD